MPLDLVPGLEAPARMAWSDRMRLLWRARSGTYRTVFGTPQGQIVLRDLLKRGWMFDTSHDPSNPTNTAYREGQRSQALHIVRMMRLTPAEIEGLVQEQAKQGDEPWPS